MNAERRSLFLRTWPAQLPRVVAGTLKQRITRKIQHVLHLTT